jgi:hypothetical protein
VGVWRRRGSGDTETVVPILAALGSISLATRHQPPLKPPLSVGYFVFLTAQLICLCQRGVKLSSYYMRRGGGGGPYLFNAQTNHFYIRSGAGSFDSLHTLELGCPFFASYKKMRNEAKKMQKQTLSRPEEAKLSKTK